MAILTHEAVQEFLLECGYVKTLKRFVKESGVAPLPKTAPLFSSETNTREEATGWDLNSRTVCGEGNEFSAHDNTAVTQGGTRKRHKKKSTEYVPKKHEDLIKVLLPSEQIIEGERYPGEKKAPLLCGASGPDLKITGLCNVSTPNLNASNVDEVSPVKNTVRFARIDEVKWKKTIKDERLLDQSYSNKGGDAFARKAAEDLGKVRGKSFRKEMQKKKRATWNGVGLIESDKINSVIFDSD